MRRKDLEITETAAIEEIIKKAPCCRLGFADGKRPYIVPLSFGFRREDGADVFYFHSGKEGRKVDLIRSLGYAAFQLDHDLHINESEKACDFSVRYGSVFGEGEIRELTDPAEKIEGLLHIMEQATGHRNFEFPQTALDNTLVFRLVAGELSAKGHS